MATSNKKISSVLLSVFLTLVMCLGIFAVSPIKAHAAGGDGSVANPYIIETADELQDTATGDLSAHYILGNDIDMTTLTAPPFTPFTPIGNDSNPFTGSFDGRGHTISNLTISYSGDDNQGLFGYIDTGGEVNNVILSNATVAGDQYVGGIAGYNMGTISNCTVEATTPGSSSITGSLDVGGIAGRNEGTISDCINVDVTVTCSTTSAGGIVGANNTGGKIERCQNSGSVTGFSIAGGIAGASYDAGSSITDCLNSGSVMTTRTSSNAGGIAGINSNGGAIVRCVNKGNISGGTGVGSETGGIVGQNSASSIRNSAALNISITDGSYIGRIVGSNYSGTLNNNHANAAMTGGTFTDKTTTGKDGADLDLTTLTADFWNTTLAFAGNTTAWDLSTAASPALVPKYMVLFEDLWTDAAPASYTPTQNILSGGFAASPTPPTRPGYVFADWYTDSAFNTLFNFGTTISLKTSLYAKWDPAPPSAPGSTTVNPKTGDETPLGLLISLIAVAGAVLIIRRKLTSQS